MDYVNIAGIKNIYLIEMIIQVPLVSLNVTGILY